MKILHIINNLGSGGAEKLLEESLPIMHQKGVEVDVLLLTDYNNVFHENLMQSGIKIKIVPLKNIYNPLNIFYIKKYIIEEKYNIVHAHLFPTIYWVSIASMLIFKNKPKFIMTEHNTFNKRRRKRYLRFIEKIIYSNYDKIISISQKTQENLLAWLSPRKNDLNKFVVVENGINIDRFVDALPYKKKEICNEFDDDTKLICMIGSFSEQKDQSTLIKAMQDLPKNIQLLLIGEGPLKQENENLAKKIKVKNRVHFLGFRNDVDRILKTVDIVVLSSNWEGFGLAAVEGMAAGKPVITSRVDGLQQVIGNPKLLFEKRNTKELVKIIQRLLNDKKEYKKSANFCSERSHAYDIKRMVERYIEVYKRLIK